MGTRARVGGESAAKAQAATTHAPTGATMSIALPAQVGGSIAERARLDPRQSLAGAIQAASGRGGPPPRELGRTFGGRLDVDAGGVRVRTDAAADRLARSLETRAFTPGGAVQCEATGSGPAVVQMLASGGGRRSGDILQTAAAGVQGPGAPLPHAATLQRSFGARDLGRIRAHTDDAAALAAVSIGAQAYAFGHRIAFAEPNPSVHVVAHEVAHVLQQEAGVQLPHGVGQVGDRHEQQADAIGAAVSRGESVAPLLGPPGATTPAVARPAVQRLNVDARTAAAVKKRIADRSDKPGKGKRSKARAVEVEIDDRFYSFARDRALVAVGIASMADDPKFEAAAERFEARIGSLAYNHPLARAVCRAASAKVLAYVERKYRDTQDSAAKIARELSSFGIDRADWSGAVGKNAGAIRNVLTRGSVSEQVAHVENFVCNVLNVDMMENKFAWETVAFRSGFATEALQEARERVRGTGDRYLAYDLPEGGASARQWHTRVGVGRVKQEAELPHVPLHPSAVTQRGVETESQTATTRPKQQIEAAFPVGLGVKLGAEEARFQEEATGSKDRLKWEEGARVWMLNELDSWVHAQRALSLPLAAGTSSTTARIMQSFKFLGVGPPDDVRLAAIGALLPPRHHTLVEIMFGARPFGTTPYREGAMMYHDLAPLTEQEVRGVAQFYPDEKIEADPVPQVQPAQAQQPQAQQPHLQQPQVAQPLVPQPLVPQPLVPQQLTPEQRGLRDLRQELPAAIPQQRPAFTHTRESLKSAHGISNVFKDRNSAQARMLRAVDAYHAASPDDVLARLRALTRVRDEAAHWLVKHGTDWFKSASTIATFERLRGEAAAVIADHENRYMLDLASDRMLADPHHAYQGHQQVEEAQGADPTEGQQLIKQYGLTEAECAAIATYVGPAYKFINPGLEKDEGRMMGRLMGFATETEQNFGATEQEKQTRAARARQKLQDLRNKKAGAITEAQRHAIVATLGLDKLPVYTGVVYAGGALTTKEAHERFKTGEVQKRASFASTTHQKLMAQNFAATKWFDLNQAYELDPRPEKRPFAYILTYHSKTGRNIEAFSHKPEEHEVLFAPNSKLRITRGAKDARPDPDQRRHFIIEAEEVV